MGFATKFLIGSVVVAIASVAHPDGLLYAAMGLTVWAVSSWIWGARRSRSGRVIPILLLIAIPWSIGGTLMDGAKTGAIQQDGYVLNSIMSGFTMPVLLYLVYLGGLMVLDFMRYMSFDFGHFMDRRNKPDDKPSYLSRFFWF